MGMIRSVAVAVVSFKQNWTLDVKAGPRTLQIGLLRREAEKLMGIFCTFIVWVSSEVHVWKTESRVCSGLCISNEQDMKFAHLMPRPQESDTKDGKHDLNYLSKIFRYYRLEFAVAGAVCCASSCLCLCFSSMS